MKTKNARLPNALLDTAPITIKSIDNPVHRIHPDDLREIKAAFEFCWPDNAPRDVFHGVQLVEDVEAARLPRKAL